MSRIQAVSFDAGGTLIEPRPSVGAVYSEVAREFGVECSADDLTARFLSAWNGRAGFRYSRDEWFEVVRQTFAGSGEVSPELFDAIYERFARREAWLIHDDVIPTLERLRQLECPIAVISNWDERLEPLLAALGLASYFDAVIVSARVGAHKPDRRIFEHAAQTLALPLSAILHVGDSEREDARGAREAGMVARRICRSGAARKDEITSLIEITRLLEG